MGTTMNKKTYQKMIDENIQELEKYMPEHSLEKKYIIQTLKWSVSQLYGDESTSKQINVNTPFFGNTGVKIESEGREVITSVRRTITDDEIEKAAKKRYKLPTPNFVYASCALGFEEGAKWMRSQLQSLPKEPTPELRDEDKNKVHCAKCGKKHNPVFYVCTDCMGKGI